MCWPLKTPFRIRKIAAEVFAAAQQRAASFEGHVVSLAAAASEEGKLFGSVGPRDIAKAVTDSGKALEKAKSKCQKVRFVHWVNTQLPYICMVKFKLRLKLLSLKQNKLSGIGDQKSVKATY